VPSNQCPPPPPTRHHRSNRSKDTKEARDVKTILITGASSGFGRDTAETLRHVGHSVYASMRGVQGKNREAAQALFKFGVKTVELDVSDDTSVEAGVKTVLAEAGKIDVLVNNAGIASVGVTACSG
jgi:NADP-dependent 3-hydroxy acid dehydrogenase YdfG